MTREEAVKEIEKAFEPAFANYIITALTEGATVSDKEPTTKNDLGDDCVRRKAVLNTLERMDKALDEDRTVDSYKELLKECYKVLPSVTPQEPNTGYISIDDAMLVFDDFMRGDADEEDTETFLKMLKDKTE